MGIATLGRPDHMRSCLAGLLQQTQPPARVIVVDGSHDDRTARLIAALDSDLILHVPTVVPAASRSRNIAVESADSEYIAFLDDDCLVEPHWLKSLDGALHRLDYPDVLFGSIDAPPRAGAEAIPVSSFTPDEERRWRYPTHPAKLGFAGHMVARRTTLIDVGGFDERLGPGSNLYGAEDMDLNYRLLKDGVRIVTTPSVRVVHDQWRADRELPDHFYRYNLAHSAFCAKHLIGGDLYPLLMFSEQVIDDLKMLASSVRRRSRLRATVARGRAVGTWKGLAAGKRVFGGAEGER